MKNQKFYSQPTCSSLCENIMYEVVRRNDTTGNLEPIGFQCQYEYVTQFVASVLNQYYSNNL